jgi:hypothetical protein
VDLTYLPLSELQPNPANPKDHDLGAIAEAIRTHGYVAPVIRDERTGYLLAGHGRVELLRHLAARGEQPPAGIERDPAGAWLVPTVTGYATVSDDQARRYLIADNRTTELGGWDEAALAELLTDLASTDSGLVGTGYDGEDLDRLLADLDREPIGPEGGEPAGPTGEQRGSLAARFGAPPFSVLDARQGYWKARKQAWLSLGIRSELGRGEDLLQLDGAYARQAGYSSTVPTPAPGAGGMGQQMLRKGARMPNTDSRGRVVFAADSKKAQAAASYASQDRLDALQRTGSSKLGQRNAAQGLYAVQADDGTLEWVPTTGGGVSIFDPVLCELVYRWWLPEPGGVVLDPFAGGSVRGVVAGWLGHAYHGVELRAEQVEANRVQAAELWAPARRPAEVTQPEARCAEPANLAAAIEAGRPVLRPTLTATGPGATAALELYAGTSSLPLQDTWQVPDELADYLHLAYGPHAEQLQAERTGPAAPWGELTDDGTCWVQFSGGKDSVAAALLAEAAGYRVVCYHLAGLNRGMGDELEYARATCEARGWPLYVDRVRASGKKNGLVELPTKNQVSALAMLARMAEVGGAVWTAGWHTAAYQDRKTWGYDWTDGTQVIAAFDRYLDARYPGHRRLAPLEDTLHAWATVAGAGLLQYVKGCVCPVRFKARRRATNEQKFGPLLHGRCGSCPKCAWEQVALEALGISEPRPDLTAHGERFLLADFGTDELRTPEQITGWLVPPERAAALARDDWPEQPAPGAPATQADQPADQTPELTPVEQAGPYLIKREDHYRLAGQQGAKVRVLDRLLAGATGGVVTAEHRDSAQLPIVAAIAARHGLPCRAHVPTGERTPEMLQAEALGAELVAHQPGHSSVLIARARDDAEARGWVQVPWALACQEARDLTAAQVSVAQLTGAERLVVPVGSGMTLAGVLHGLTTAEQLHGLDPVPPVVGVVVGGSPEKLLDTYAPEGWRELVTLVEAEGDYHQPAPVTSLHGVELDPLYEAKCLPHLQPGDLLWIVGRRTTGAGTQPGASELGEPAGPRPAWYAGDSAEVLAAGAEGLPAAVDLVFTCPPYADLEVYSDDPADLSTMDWPAFREQYRTILARATARLREGRFAVIVVGEARDSSGAYYGLVPETIEAMRAAGLAYHGEAVLVTAVGSLAVRAGRHFNAGRKLGKSHQNVLVFYRGDPREVGRTFGPVVQPDDLAGELDPEQLATADLSPEPDGGAP